MNFGYYRFGLSTVKPSVFQDLERSREEVIEEIFSEGKGYSFFSNGATYGFLVKKVEGKKVLARIAKKKDATYHTSLSDGFEEKHVEDWPGSYLIINLDDEKETGLTEQSGQIIAMQHNTNVISSPINCLRLLATKINTEIFGYGYEMSINPISNKRKNFWSVVERHHDDIKKIVLVYVMPNMLNLANKIDEDLKKIRDKYNATNTEVIIENKTGNINIVHDNIFVRESVEYIEMGGGLYKVYLRKSKKIIKSDDNVVIEKFESVKVENIDGESIIKKEFERICKIVLEKKHDD